PTARWGGGTCLGTQLLTARATGVEPAPGEKYERTYLAGRQYRRSEKGSQRQLSNLHSRIKNEEPLWLCPCEGLRRAGSKPPSPVHRRVLGAILAEAHARAYGSNLCRNDGSRESLELPAGRLLRHYD